VRHKSRGDILRVKSSYIAIFTGGLILGALAQHGLPRIFPTTAEKIWRSQNSEDSDHARIMAFQDVLNRQGAPKDTEALRKQIEAQLKIEELIIQSRAAQYATLAPLTSFTSSVGALLIALLGFLAGLLGKKRDAATTPKP
jgi:hypothetical protein